MCGAGNGSVLVLYLRCRCIGLRLGLRLLYMQKSTRASGAQYIHVLARRDIGYGAMFITDHLSAQQLAL